MTNQEAADKLMQQVLDRIKGLEQATHQASNDLTAKQLEMQDLRKQLRQKEDSYNAGVVLLADARETLAKLKAAIGKA
jgi:DNA polymerase III epsilon subunit-like protein